MQPLKKLGSLVSISAVGEILVLLKASVAVGFAIVLNCNSALLFFKKGVMKLAQPQLAVTNSSSSVPRLKEKGGLKLSQTESKIKNFALSSIAGKVRSNPQPVEGE